MLTLVKNTRVSFGKNLTPSGVEYTGIKVTIGDVLDPSTVKRTYDDIEAILHQNKVEYKIHETKDINGHFRSYTVEV